MKRIFYLLMLFGISLLFLPNQANANTYFYDGNIPCVETDKPLTIHVDGKYLYTDNSPIIQDGRTLMPLRAAGEALGAIVEWNKATQSINVTKDNKEIHFEIGNKEYLVDGNVFVTDVAPLIQNGRTFLPLRAFAEALDTEIKWDKNLYDVAINTDREDFVVPELPESAISPNNKPIADQLLKKYYVESDPSDPYVGSWQFDTFEVHQGILALADKFLFVTKVNGEYNVVKASVTHQAGRRYNDIAVMEDKSRCIAINEFNNVYTIDFDAYCGDVSYYRGVNMEQAPAIRYEDRYILDHERDTLRHCYRLVAGTNQNVLLDPLLYTRI